VSVDGRKKGNRAPTLGQGTGGEMKKKRERTRRLDGGKKMTEKNSVHRGT